MGGVPKMVNTTSGPILPSKVLRSRRLLLIPPDDRARGYFDMAGFGHVAYVVPFEHD
ncbi:hypothetical protein PIB30_092606 [Stylosanthes scabra]|uniref:Uncharacterized protein n=1 Tax=Stylosanthes scabra TaxID=79078 RepID=A0ABU6TUE1_9FABA|nr:hypothetical protein [Stylosanthes scabra]